jgi:hypothetical protein
LERELETALPLLAQRLARGQRPVGFCERL